MDILDEYVNLIPMHQNAVNLFESEWSSKFPSSFALETQPGIAGLFEDGRIAWGNSIFGGFSVGIHLCSKILEPDTFSPLKQTRGHL